MRTIPTGRGGAKGATGATGPTGPSGATAKLGAIVANGPSYGNIGTVLTVRFAAGVPVGAPVTTELPIAFDSTAVTGGIYYWTGAAWVKAL